MPDSLSTHRLGRITYAQFQAALDRFDLGRLLSAQAIPFGLFGQNVILVTDRGRYVLRVCSHYPWQFPKERFFARLLHERSDAPIPWPYLVETSPTILGWDFAIMPCLPGIALADQQLRRALSNEEQREIARELGRTLAAIHRVTSPFPGQYDLATDGITPLNVPYSDWVVAQTRDWVEKARQPSRAHFLPRFTLNVLLYLLIGWEYGQRHPELGWFARGETLWPWAEPIIEQTRDVAARVLEEVRHAAEGL